ncbi:hypothetical protein LTS17_011844 [Exophiala oligosperma]
MNEVCSNQRQSRIAYFRLLAYAAATWTDICLMAVGTTCAIAAGVPYPLMAVLFGELVNDLNGASCEVEISGNALVYEDAINDRVLKLVYIAIAAFALTFTHIICWSILSQRLAFRLRDEYFQSILRQDQTFIDQHQDGQLSSRLSGDVQAVQSGTCEKVGIFIASLSFFVSAYVVAFTKQAKLAGILISLIPAFLLVAIVGGGFFQKFSTRMSDSATKAAAIASEAFSNITIVKAYSAAPRLERKFAECSEVSRGQGIRKGAVAAVQAGMLYFIAYSANALAFWQGSRMIADMLKGKSGGTSVGKIYTVIFVLVDACVVLGSTAPLLPLFGNAASAFHKLKQDIDSKSLLDGTLDDGDMLSAETPGKLEFCNVSFRYPSRPDDMVLRNVSVSFPAGKQTAIVGPSGSGKSTVAALIARLYDTTEGRILFDDKSLSDINIRNLRGFTALVQQEPLLMNRSILQNIALGLISSSNPAHKRLKHYLGESLTCNSGNLPERDQVIVNEVIDLVKHAARLADADGFIRTLDKSYDTIIGTGGQSLSGGQRQRIALAQALVRDPKVLILDEATASLDSASEQRIQTAVNKLANTRTVISIAHRFSTIRNADNIIILKAGEVIEQGTYEELVSHPGLFADMVKLQALNISQQNHEDFSSTISSLHTSIDIDAEKVALKYDDATSRAQPKLYEDSGGNKDPQASPIEIDSGLSPCKIIRRATPFIRPELGWLVMAMIAAVVVGLTFIAAALIFGHVVDALSPCRATVSRILHLGRFYGGMLFMVAGVELGANYFSWSSFAVVGERLLYRLRVLSFNSLLSQNIEWYQAQAHNPSTLLSIITKDGNAIAGFSGSTMGTIFSILISFCASLIMSHIVAWKIALVCLTMVPILLGSGLMQLFTLSRFEERNSKAFAKSIGICMEALTSFKIVATYSLEDEIMGAYRQALRSPRKKLTTASIYTNVWLAISLSVGFFIYAFAYWWGSHQIIRGESSQKQFFIVLVAMLVSAQLWGQMFSLAPEVSRARAAASRILSIIGNQNSYGDSPALEPPSTSTGHDVEKSASTDTSSRLKAKRGARVDFSGVSFAYPSNITIPVLKDVAFSILPGQFCGLVGPSGAGKSTIMNLLQQNYCPTWGRIKIDGTDISDRDFRDDIAVVPQDSMLFSGSIRFNVGLGAVSGHDATDTEIEQACRLANIHDTIMILPQGYDTECGPKGTQLSGGQRQRLTIARALVRKPRLLLLDESTSALDAETEHILQQGLSRAVRDFGTTVIAITHRLHTVMSADVIFMVEGGTIVDSGSHGDLMEKNEHYRLTVQQQMLQ